MIYGGEVVISFTSTKAIHIHVHHTRHPLFYSYLIHYSNTTQLSKYMYIYF